jgi:hypothetical protein
VESVITEEYPASYFPFGPYPKDKLTYRSDRVVEFRTPPHSDGFGTDFGVTQNDEPINGVVILSGEGLYSITLLVLRLTPDQDDLTRYIIQQFERDEGEP